MVQAEWRSCVNVVRGGLSWPGVVVLWTGVWTLLDRHVPGGKGLWKDIGITVLGAWVMVCTRTLFSNAGMDALDHEGSLAEMGSLLAQGRLQCRDKIRFYARSLLAMTGSILFWDGVYTVCDEHAWKESLTYNMACAAIGGAGMVWVMTSEDDERQDDNDGIDGPRRVSVRGVFEGKQVGEFARLNPVRKAALYVKALFCNVCGVVFWKGVETMIEEGPDTVWTGLAYFVLGIAILSSTERLSSNSGLDDALGLTIEMHASSDGGDKPNVDRSSSLKPLNDGDARAARRPSFGHVSWRSQDGGGGGGAWGGLGPCDRCPRWVVTSIELTGVVFAWTGVEWYVWDGDYIPDTWLRDVSYIVAGVAILVATGTFFNLAGTISPMAVLKQVHQHTRHDETTPLLSSDNSQS